MAGVLAFKEHGYEPGTLFATKLVLKNEELRNNFISILGAHAQREDSLVVFYQKIKQALTKNPFNIELIDGTLKSCFKESDYIVVIFNFTLAMLDVNILNLYSDIEIKKTAQSLENLQLDHDTFKPPKPRLQSFFNSIIEKKQPINVSQNTTKSLR